MKVNYSKNVIYNYDYIKIQKLNESFYRLIQFKYPVRKPGYEDNNQHTLDDIEAQDKIIDNQDDETIRISISRTKKTILDYSLCNEFDYFATLTFDRKKHKANDIKLLKKQVGQWLNNYKKRNNNNLKYLLIPELHKDKEHFHFHGLISGIKDITEFKKSKEGIMRYNWTSWHNKFGFTSLEEVWHTEAISRYITKYITKDLFIEFNKQRFIVSKGLRKPETIFELCNYTKEIPYEFENDYVRTLNIYSKEGLAEILTYILKPTKNRKEDDYVIERSY